MKPIHEPVFLVIKKNIFVVEGEDDKIHEAAVEKELGQHQKQHANEEDQCDPICGPYVS
jgi:hypothetical protein